jgi:AraC-like DNA-binding protein
MKGIRAMNTFHNHLFQKTRLKYFFSYFLIFTILILGFFLIVRHQLTARYYNQLRNQSENQLESLSSQLNNDFTLLSQIDFSLTSNNQLMLSRYSQESWQTYQAYQELLKYDASNDLIDFICYMAKDSEQAITTSHAVLYKDGVFSIQDNKNTTVLFDPSPYYDAPSGQLIFLSSGASEYLIYFPAISAANNYVYFYCLSMEYIQRSMAPLLSGSITSIALLDNDGRIVTGVNTETLRPYLNSSGFADKLTLAAPPNSVCVQGGLRSDFSIVSILSDSTLTQQINIAFANTYHALLLLTSLGFLLVLVSMRITYWPLDRLTRKIVPESNGRLDCLEILDETFSQTSEQNQLLQDKLKKYSVSIKKSLLDTLIASSQLSKPDALPNIDSFFDIAPGKEIFAIHMAEPPSNQPFPALRIQESFQDILPEKDSCIILESSRSHALFLIHYAGSEPNKDEILKKLLYSFHAEEGFLSAISAGSASPMDIPFLCKSVLRASCCWPQIPVVDNKSFPPANDLFIYPHDKLKKLSELLKEKNFSTSKFLLSDIFQIVERSMLAENPLPDFFVHCILIDALNTIGNCLNSMNVKFQSYQDLYYESLYYCRSCSYREKSEAIASNLNRLLELCEQEANKLISPEQIQKIIQDSFCHPDFSIYILADRFHVSVAYMSNLSKKALNQDFSDYLWNLRMTKAKELLKSTNLSIDEISIAVGYLNPSSFRRRFKQETGQTPSQFRKSAETGDNPHSL